jgi:hypothetical protein
LFLRRYLQDAKSLEGNKKYTELGMVKSGVYFTTKALRLLAEDHKDCTEKYEKAQRNLVREVVNIACKIEYLRVGGTGLIVELVDSDIYAGPGVAGQRRGTSRRYSEVSAVSAP